MAALFPALCSVLLLAEPLVQTRLVQVAPVPPNGEWKRSGDKARAVVLIHGFLLHFSDEAIPVPRFRGWQRPGSRLVRALAKDADVYSLAYGHNGTLDDIVHKSRMKEDIAKLKSMGYREVVLIGHSAGGLVARHFAEDFPDSGVTKVIQVCAPNGGTPKAKFRIRKAQQALLDCLSEAGRKKALKERAGKRIPEKVEFVCVLANRDGNSDSDGTVPCDCQWTADLWEQGVPVVAVALGHNGVTRTEEGVAVLARLAREKQPRWDTAKVKKARAELFGD